MDWTHFFFFSDNTSLPSFLLTLHHLFPFLPPTLHHPTSPSFSIPTTTLYLISFLPPPNKHRHHTPPNSPSLIFPPLLNTVTYLHYILLIGLQYAPPHHAIHTVQPVSNNPTQPLSTQLTTIYATLTHTRAHNNTDHFSAPTSHVIIHPLYHFPWHHCT